MNKIVVLLLLLSIFSFTLQHKIGKEVNLVIDIGNTVAKLAVFDNEEVVEVLREIGRASCRERV